MNAAEEIPPPVGPEKSPCVDGESPMAATVRRVLDDDNLLREIIVRIGFPTTLVRAAFVCKRWLGHASDRKFLSRFRKLHLSRLLGYYISEGSFLSHEIAVTRFVPILPHPPELAAVFRRAESYKLGGHGGLQIMDCRSGSIFTEHREGRVLTHVVHRPLCPERSMDIVQPLPSPESSGPQYQNVRCNPLQCWGSLPRRQESPQHMYICCRMESGTFIPGPHASMVCILAKNLCSSTIRSMCQPLVVM